MKKSTIRTLSLAAAMTMAATSLAAPASAATASQNNKAASSAPLQKAFVGGISASNSVNLAEGASAKNEKAMYSTKSRAGMAKILNHYATKRSKSFTMRWTGSISSLYSNLGSAYDIEPLQKTFYSIPNSDSSKTTDDADYAMNAVKSYGWSGYTQNGKIYLTWQLTYWETAKQTKAVNTKVNSIVKKLKIKKAKSVSGQIKNIRKLHNYLCKSIQYDYSYPNESHNAYTALVSSKKATVCQGYAAAVYKLLAKAGITNHIMYGWANYVSDSTGHAWNIVKLGKKYYYLDATWNDIDDNYGNHYVIEDYFLKGSNRFTTDHIPNTYMESKYKKYISKTDKVK